MNQREFQKRLKEFAEGRSGSFGYPFVSLRSVAEALDLEAAALVKFLDKERAAGRVVMNPIDEKTEENLPASLLVLRFKEPDGSMGAYVSLAIKP